MSLVKVAISEVGSDTVSVKEVENDLKTMQGIVEGYIEYISITERLGIICNEEGKLKNLKPNFVFRGELYVGNVILVALENGDIVSLNDEDLELLLEIVSLFKDPETY